MKVSTIAELKRAIGKIINDTTEKDLPKEITFNRGIEYSKYKITVQAIEEDYFVDSKGVKWKKMKEEDSSQDEE